MNWQFWLSSEERTRRAASIWFGRMQGPNASSYHDAFAAWQSDERNARAYQRLALRWRDAASLSASPRMRATKLALSSRRPPPRRRALLVAVPALLALACVGTWRLARPEPPTGFADRVTTRRGEIRTIVLSDGSRVTLDTQTVIRLAFSPQERSLTLIEGRARFDVAHDGTRPFVVAAVGRRVIAHGTVFDVAVQGARANVVLLRGAIEVAPGQRTPDRSARMLTPGQQLSFVDAQPLAVAAQKTRSALRWPNGMLDFNDIRLGDAIDEINRYNRIQIQITQEDVANLRITGAFHGNAPASFAQAVSGMFHVRLLRRPGGALLLSR
jgi:transmembrane sensor